MRNIFNHRWFTLSTQNFAVILLALVTFLSRLFFQPPTIESFDAVNYILALSHFDMRLGQPQAPGYFLYILLGRLIMVVISNPQQALLFLSALSSGAVVITIYLAAAEIFGGKTGLIASALLACAPFFWFTGELVAPYSTDLFLSLLFYWLAFRTQKRDDNRSLPWITALVLGLAGALRLQTFIFLFLLFIYSIRKRPAGVIMGSSLFAVGVFGAFFIPSVMLSGGFNSFLRLMFTNVPIVSSSSSFINSLDLRRFIYNAVVLLRYTFMVVGDLLWPVIFAGLYYLWKSQKAWRRVRLEFFLIGILPSWIVFFLIWAGNIATIQVTTGVFFIIAAFGIQKLIENNAPMIHRGGWAILMIIVTAQTLFFSLLPERPLGEGFHRLYNWDLLKRTAASYQNKISLIRSFPVDQTVVFAYEFRLPQYYLPQYTTFSNPSFKRDEPDTVDSVHVVEMGQVRDISNVRFDELLPANTRTIIFYDLPLFDIEFHDVNFKRLSKQSDEILVVDLTNGQHIQWTSSGMSVQ